MDFFYRYVPNILKVFMNEYNFISKGGIMESILVEKQRSFSFQKYQ